MEEIKKEEPAVSVTIENSGTLVSNAWETVALRVAQFEEITKRQRDAVKLACLQALAELQKLSELLREDENEKN